MDGHSKHKNTDKHTQPVFSFEFMISMQVRRTSNDGQCELIFFSTFTQNQSTLMMMTAMPPTKEEWKATTNDLDGNPEKAHTMMRAYSMSDEFTKQAESKQGSWKKLTFECINGSYGYNPKEIETRDSHQIAINKHFKQHMGTE